MDSQKKNRFWHLHSLLGLLLGLPLFIIFVAGTLALLEPHALNWLQPQYQSPPQQLPPLNQRLHNLLAKHPGTNEAFLVLPSPQRPVLDLYLLQNHEEIAHLWLDPSTLESQPATPHEADLFHFFIDLHYFAFLPFGQEITGLIAALYFALILTGLVYQWRHLRRDAHPRNLSLQSRQRWKNIHRFTSIFTLPFQATYAITGAALALGLLLASPAILFFFQGDPQQLNQALFPAESQTAAPDSQRPLPPIDQALTTARQHWPEHVQPFFLRLTEQPATEHTPASRTLLINGRDTRPHLVGTHVLVLDDHLQLLHDQTPTSHLAPMLIESIVNLHFATFSSLGLRGLFVLLGLTVSLSIAAGILIFLRRRLASPSPPTRLSHLLKTLTHWLLGGFPLAIALALHSAHLLPDFPLLILSTTLALSLALIARWPHHLSSQALFAGLTFLLLPLTFTLVHHQSPIQLGSPHAHLLTAYNLFFPLLGLGILTLRKILRSRSKS